MDIAFIDDVCATLQTGVEIVRAASGTAAESPTRDRVAAVAEGIKSEAAKVGYMFSQKIRPDKVSGPSLIAGLRDTATTLCMLFAAAASGGGHTLRKSLERTIDSVIKATVGLIKAAALAEDTELAVAALPQVAGLLMERCDIAAKAPLDDKTAIGRALTTVARQIVDAASELAEELKEDDNEEDGDETEQSEKDQKEIIKGAMDVLQAAGNVVRATMRELLTADASPDQSGELWESILFHGKQLASAADDLAIASYSSDDKEDVKGSLESVVTGCQLIGEEVETVSDSVLAVEAAGEKLLSLL